MVVDLAVAQRPSFAGWAAATTVPKNMPPSRGQRHELCGHWSGQTGASLSARPRPSTFSEVTASPSFFFSAPDRECRRFREALARPQQPPEGAARLRPVSQAKGSGGERRSALRLAHDRGKRGCLPQLDPQPAVPRRPCRGGRDPQAAPRLPALRGLHRHTRKQRRQGLSPSYDPRLRDLRVLRSDSFLQRFTPNRPRQRVPLARPRAAGLRQARYFGLLPLEQADRQWFHRSVQQQARIRMSERSMVHELFPRGRRVRGCQ